MNTQWIADGVLRIATTKRDNAFLVDGADGLTLIDVGWANTPAALSHDPSQRIGSLKRLPQNIGAIGFAHGTPLIGGAVESYYEWLAAQ